MKQYTGVRFLLFANLPCSGRTEKINSVCGLGDSQLVHNHICVDSYWEFLTRSAEKKPELINYHIYLFGQRLLQGVCLLVFINAVQFLYRKRTFKGKFTWSKPQLQTEKQFSSALSSVFCSISKPHPNLEILAGFVHTGKRLHLLQRADSIERHKRQGADTDKKLTLGNTVTWVLQKSHLKTIHLDMLMSTEEATITLVLGRKQAKPEVSSKGACASSAQCCTSLVFAPKSFLWMLLLGC